MACKSTLLERLNHCKWPCRVGVVALMSVRMASRLPLIVLLMFAGGCSGVDWGVNYISTYICALEGSSVTMPCTYTYPPEYQVKEVFWTKTLMNKGIEPSDLSKDPEYSERIEYVGDKDHDCTVRLTDVRHTDSHVYYFRFITNITGGNWIGKPGVYLKVTDLQVETQQRVKEGDSVTLTCKIKCSLTERSTFIWYKNTQLLSERTDRKNQLILSSVSRDDAGDYSCAVKRHRDLRSPARRLTVIYAPQETVVTVESSGVIMEGDSVNLICSSDANPPVHNYSWFKEKSPVGSGKIYIISNISSDHSGEYKCKAGNEVGVKYSTAVILHVMYPPRNTSASISGSSGVIMEDDSVNLTCSSDANPPAHNYSWFMENKTSSVGSGPSFRALESGWFYCVAQNEHGSQRSDAVSVTLDGGRNFLLYSVVGIISGFGGLFFIFIILFIWKKIQRSNIREEQDNNTTHRETKMHDDPSDNIYTNFIPACRMPEDMSISPADADDGYGIYVNCDPVHMSSEDVYCIPDVHHDDIYINPNIYRSCESDHVTSNL